MIKTFTQDDLIRFLYNECAEQEKQEISKALLCDAELQESFKELLAVKRQINAAKLNPSNETVEKILAASKKK
ncbi:MAG TPA: hypothetical protein PKC24_00770 [Cyclobacteriaceae bacterium]|mgnify:CR=1 FL=1|nr:hypothetical protein [Cyclobacteriaceae bacterium]